MAVQLTTGAMYLKRGDGHDPEDWRMTHRLGVAQNLLHDAGYELIAEHVEPTGGIGSPREVYTERPLSPSHLYRCGSGIGCSYRWEDKMEQGVAPPNELFNAIFAMANALQNAKHARTVRMTNEYDRAKRAS